MRQRIGVCVMEERGARIENKAEVEEQESC